MSLSRHSAVGQAQHHDVIGSGGALGRFAGGFDLVDSNRSIGVAE